MGIPGVTAQSFNHWLQPVVNRPPWWLRQNDQNTGQGQQQQGEQQGEEERDAQGWARKAQVVSGSSSLIPRKRDTRRVTIVEG